MDQAALLAELNIRIGDTDNFTFTSNEKTSAINEAIHDQYVQTDVWDDSLTFDTNTYRYAVPDSLSVVNDIYIRANNTTDEPEKISGSLWEVVDGYIQFRPGSQVIPDGNTLFLRGRLNYTTASTISEISVQEYVLNLAQFHLYKIMLSKKSMRFLKNDTSVAEIVTIKRELERDVLRYRQSLPKSYQAG